MRYRPGRLRSSSMLAPGLEYKAHRLAGEEIEVPRRGAALAEPTTRYFVNNLRVSRNGK